MHAVQLLNRVTFKTSIPRIFVGYGCQVSQGCDTVSKCHETSQVNMAVWSTLLRSTGRNVQLLKSINTPIASKLTQNGNSVSVFLVNNFSFIRPYRFTTPSSF